MKSDWTSVLSSLKGVEGDALQHDHAAFWGESQSQSHAMWGHPLSLMEEPGWVQLLKTNAFCSIWNDFWVLPCFISEFPFLPPPLLQVSSQCYLEGSVCFSLPHYLGKIILNHMPHNFFCCCSVMGWVGDGGGSHGKTTFTYYWFHTVIILIWHNTLLMCLQ